jgi:hypothetical protein
MKPIAIQCGVIVENIDYFKIVFLAERFVVNIVCRRNLKAARTKFNIDVFILNYRKAAVGNLDDIAVSL